MNAIIARTCTAYMFLAISVISTGCASEAVSQRKDGVITVNEDSSTLVFKFADTSNSILTGGSKGRLITGLADKGNRVLVGAMLEPDGRPYLAVGSPEPGSGKGVVLLQLDENGEPTLSVTGESRSDHIVAGTSESGAANITVVAGDQSTGPRLRMGMADTPDGKTPRISLKADGRQFSHALGFSEGKYPLFEMTDSKGRARVRIGVGVNDEPYIELLDESGKVTWNAK